MKYLLTQSVSHCIMCILEHGLWRLFERVFSDDLALLSRLNSTVLQAFLALLYFYSTILLARNGVMPCVIQDGNFPKQEG